MKVWLIFAQILTLVNFVVFFITDELTFGIYMIFIYLLSMSIEKEIDKKEQKQEQ